MNRLLLSAAASLLAAWALLDPYTFYSGAGDAVTFAPLWQTVLGLVDVALVITFVALTWRGRFLPAIAVLVAEGLWVLVVSTVYLKRDGLSRFAAGFAGDEFLSLYLGTFALRLILLLALSRAIHLGRTAS